MKIGIDIDGVLNNQQEFCISYGSKFCSELGEYSLKNCNEIDTTEMFMWSEEIAHEFWNKYRNELVSNIPARMYSSEIIYKLKQKGYRIYIITARKNQDEWYPDYMKNDVEKYTIKWLEENNIVYDEIYFDIRDKGEFCRVNNIEVMIEDDPKNIRMLINKTYPIIFNNPYNQNKEFDNIERAYSWYDLYDKLIKMEENK